MRRRLADARVARLATVRPDGRPHLVPCCFALDGETLYSAVDAKPKTTLALQRLENLAAHPAVSLVADHYEEDWSALWWVRVDGVARVLRPGAGGDPGDEGSRTALDLLAAKYPQYRDRPPPGPVVAIDIVTWRAWP
jgi:PPOX class probable F420-dependent enzyme